MQAFLTSPSDMELAAFWAYHIENPCEDLYGNNIREFYLREAERNVLPKLENPHAVEFLRNVIEAYRRNYKR